MSKHEVLVVEIGAVMPHPNANALELTQVNGWQVVIKKGQFKTGDKAVYIEPDYVVPTYRPEFSFLAKDGKTTHRLKAIRLRGELSFGLLIDMPKELGHFHVGSDCMEYLGVTRYEPPIKYLHSNELPDDQAPKLYVPKFDIESYNKYKYLIRPGENVIATEKIHGANARYVYHDGQFYMGSRNRWIDPTTDSVWKAAISEQPQIEEFCRNNPDTIVFGEVFGKVQGLRYGLGEKVSFVGFAGLDKNGWISQPKLFDMLMARDVQIAPIVYTGPFDPDRIAELVEGDSLIEEAPAGHMMEGVVIVPETERHGPSAGRTALKLISNRYWLSNEA